MIADEPVQVIASRGKDNAELLFDEMDPLGLFYEDPFSFK